jgi:acetyltransferase-like isoleucine patch superfamily enzyme
MLIAKSRLPIRQILLFGFWPSAIKKLIYRLKGYRIGTGASLGFGSVICGKDVEVGAHTRLGFFTIIRGTHIRLGAHVSIGSATMLDTPSIDIGDGTKINEQVFVGGLQFPDSRLVVGRNCQIMQMTFINPARSISIGDDTGIGGDCLLFGHTSWLSKFEGYHVDFQPITIGNNVSVSWRVFVLPGSKIGDGAVIGANSLVNRSIPPRCLAVGFPAKVVSKAPYLPRVVTDVEKVKYLQDIVSEMATYFQGFGFECRQNGSMYEVIRRKRLFWWSSRRTWRLWVEYEPVLDNILPTVANTAHVFLSLRKLPDQIRESLAQRRSMWIDIESKQRPNFGNDLGEEVVEYLKRYGVRLFRVG